MITDWWEITAEENECAYLRHNEENADRMIRNGANKRVCGCVCEFVWVCVRGGDVHMRDRCSLARVYLDMES